MIYGIGCDLCAAERMEKILIRQQGEHFARRVFSEQELARLDTLSGPHRAESAAADFAAKEAFFKAAGVGLGTFALAEVSALRQPGGAPCYAFTGKAARWVEEHRLRAHLTLSHEGGMALAFCLLETRE